MNGNRVRPSRLSLGWAASQFDEKLFKVRRRGSLRRPLSSIIRSAASIAGRDGVDGERASAPTMIEEVRFADSLLEGDGFELPVPRQGQRVFATPVQFSSYPPVGKTLFLWDRDAGPPPPYRLSSYNMPRRSGPATRSVAPDTAGVKSPAPTPSWRKTP